MATTTFIWLGSGRAKRRGVGPKGLYLDQAAKAGLPVPAGAILLDELYRIFVEKGVAVERDGRVIVPDHELLFNTLYYSARLPRFLRPAAVRAGFGDYYAPPARLGVDMNDATAVAAALAAIWSAASRSTTRADILVMDMVASAHAGTAVTRQGTAEDVVTTTGGPPGEQVGLSQLRGWAGPAESEPPHLRRLQMLLRGVRRTFGRGEWQINWIDDGQICYLIQVMPGESGHTPE